MDVLYFAGTGVQDNFAEKHAKLANPVCNADCAGVLLASCQ